MSTQRTSNWIFTGRARQLALTVCLALLWCSSSLGNPPMPDSILKLEAPGFHEVLYSPARPYHPDHPTVALALSGGGARGLSQIGILRALEEYNIPIVGIAGTSMGAIMGGLFAAGYTPAQLDSLARSIRWAELFSDSPPRSYLLLPQKDIRARSFLTLHFRGWRPNLPAAVTAGQRLVRILTELLHAPNYHSRSDFDSLQIPFRSVATDLVSGRTIIQDRGDLVMSLRASSAFPLAQYPVTVDSMILVDGGLTNPLPVNVARSFGADYVIAINTASELEPHSALDNIYGVANQSTTIMTRPQLYQSVRQADALIQPDLIEFTNLDFEMADSLIARGYRTARHVLDSLMAHGWPDRIIDEDTEDLILDSVVAVDPTKTLSADALAAETNPSRMTLSRLREKLSAVLNEGSVQRVTTQLHRDSGAVFATVNTQPYPHLTAVQFTGNTVFPDTVLRAEFADQIEHPVNSQHVAAAARRCLDLYENQAYSLAEITEISLDSASGNLSITVDEGRLAGLQVTGNETVKDWVITRHFPLKRGRLFNYRALLEGMENLHASGLFSQVNVKIERAVTGPLITLDVKEKDYDIVRFGLRHDLEYQTDVFVEIVNTNILGLGNEMYLHVGYCPRRERYAAGFRAARVFRTYLTSDLTAYREIHERRLYVDNHRAGFFETARNGLAMSLGQNLKRFGTISGTFRSEDIKLTRQPPLPTTNVRLRSLVVAARYDDLDRLPFTTIGRRVKVSIEWADDFAGGNVIYRKIGISLENWFSPTEQLTLGQRITLGSGDRTLPLYEQYALGGRKSMLGLHNDEFLGDKIFSANFDCRFRFFPRSYLNFRLDLGTVWDHKQEIDLFDDLRVGGGLGPSFDTPLGPLELYWGATEDDYTNFYFNWGYDF